MKKIALAVLVALGAVTVNAAPTTDTDVAAALTTKSVPVKMDSVKKNAAVAWIKAHPVIASGIAATVFATIVFGGAALLKSDKADAGRIAKAAQSIWNGGAYVAHLPVAGYQKAAAGVSTAATAVKNNFVTHKAAYIVPASVVTVITAAVIDMVVRGDKSVVKFLWHKIKPVKQQPAPVVAK